MTIGLAAAAAAVYVLLVVMTFVAFFDRGFRLRPNLEDLRQVSQLNDAAATRAWVASEMMQAVVANEARIRLKSRFLTAALALWAVDILLFGALALSVSF